MTELDRLIEIEESFWTADADFYRRNLAADFLMAYPGLGIMTRDETIAGLARGPRWASVRIRNPRLVPLSADSVVLAYDADARREGVSADHHALVSSVYVHRGDAWLLAFHHQTPLAGG